MDVSPRSRDAACSTSTPSTPLDLKRSREEELEAYLQAGPTTNKSRMETTPCQTPVQSPEHSINVAMRLSTPCFMGTPVSSHVCVGASTGQADLRLLYASAQRQGPRSYMEDRSQHVFDESHLPHAYFAVFDGHGGEEVADFCSQHLHRNMRDSQHFPDLVPALQDGFLLTDADLLRRAAEHPRKKESNAGAAAIVTVITAHQIVVAHAGDCRAVLVKRNGGFVDLTADHTADDETCQPAAASIQLRPDELARVRRAGGKVDSGYVYVGEHNLPMTRALGDLRLKVAGGRDWRSTSVDNQVVTALPEVSVVQRSADDLAVILASDGLFGNVMSSANVAEIVQQQLSAHEHSGDAQGKTARHLVGCALEEHNGTDNVSVTVVSLDPPPPPFALNGGPVPLEHVCSQQSMTTQALSPGRAGFKDKLSLPFVEAFGRDPPGNC